MTRAILVIALALFSFSATAAATPVAVTVQPNTPWTNTGVDVRAGDGLVIIARGEWSRGDDTPRSGPAGNGSDPSATLPSAPAGALIGKIGTIVFLVGDNYRQQAPAAGRLFIGINDEPGAYGDNIGEMHASVDVVPVAAPLPNFVGTSYESAVVYLKEHSLVATRFVRRSNRPNEEVLVQYPEPGVDEHTIKVVVLGVSGGPPTRPPAVMPNVVGQTVEEALRMISSLTSVARTVGRGYSRYPKDEVFRQDPAPGARLADVKTIVLSVSDGPAPTVTPAPSSPSPSPSPSTTELPVPVPSIIGMSERDGINTIEQSGLRPRRESKRSGCGIGAISRTSPVASTPVARGTAIDYWLVFGPVAVPVLTRRSIDEAQALLRNHCLKLGDVRYRLQWADEGMITAQDPAPHAQADQDGTVAIEVATRDDLWIAFVIIGGLLGFAAVAVAGRLLLEAKTRRLLSIRTTIDPIGSTAFSTDVTTTGPTTRLRARLDEGPTKFQGDTPIVKREVKR